MNDQVPAHFSKPSRNVGAAAREGLTSAMPPHISLRNGRFALVDAGGQRYPWTELHIDVVLFDANPHKSKRYFEGDYDPNSGKPPTCYSDNGVAPSRNAQTPQARTCAECRWSGWNSAVSKLTGKGIPACQDRKKLAAYPVDDEADMAYLLDVPPTSLNALQTYSDFVGTVTVPGGSRKADLPDFVTRISFEDQGNAQFKLKFEAVEWINVEMAGRCEQIFQAGVSEVLVNKTDQPYQGALPAPAAQAQIAQQTTTIGNPAPAGPTLRVGATSAASPQPSLDEPGKSRRGGTRQGAGRPRKPVGETFSANQQAAEPARTTAPLDGEVMPPAGASPREQGTPIPAFLLRSREAAQGAAPAGNGAVNEPATAQPHEALKAGLGAAFNLPIRK